MALAGRDYVQVLICGEMRDLRYTAKVNRAGAGSNHLARADAIEQYLRNGIPPMTNPQIEMVIDAIEKTYFIPPICDDATKATWEPAKRDMVAELQKALDDRASLY